MLSRSAVWPIKLPTGVYIPLNRPTFFCEMRRVAKLALSAARSALPTAASTSTSTRSKESYVVRNGGQSAGIKWDRTQNVDTGAEFNDMDADEGMTKTRSRVSRKNDFSPPDYSRETRRGNDGHLSLESERRPRRDAWEDQLRSENYGDRKKSTHVREWRGRKELDGAEPFFGKPQRDSYKNRETSQSRPTTWGGERPRSNSWNRHKPYSDDRPRPYSEDNPRPYSRDRQGSYSGGGPRIAWKSNLEGHEYVPKWRSPRTSPDPGAQSFTVRANAKAEKTEMSPAFVKYSKLARDKAYREKTGSMLISGLAALESVPAGALKSIMYTSEEALEKAKTLVGPGAVEYNAVSRKELQELSGEHNPDLVLAEVGLPEVRTLDQSVRFSRMVAVYNCRDGANLGLIVRSAAAFGYEGLVIIGKGSVDPFNLFASRSSTGAILHLPVYRVSSFEELLGRDDGAQVVLAEVPSKLQPGSAAHDNGIIREGECSKEKPFVLVLGNEQTGYDTAVSESPGVCKIALPVAPKIGCVNVAVAGSILMHLLR